MLRVVEIQHAFHKNCIPGHLQPMSVHHMLSSSYSAQCQSTLQGQQIAGDCATNPEHFSASCDSSSCVAPLSCTIQYTCVSVMFEYCHAKGSIEPIINPQHHSTREISTPFCSTLCDLKTHRKRQNKEPSAPAGCKR